MGVVSLLFLIIYYLDPSVLSGVSCFVMFLCPADYLVPILALRIFGSNKGTTEQQQRSHEICSHLVKTRRRAVGWSEHLFSLKEEKPKMYFMTTIVSLAVVAWVGQQVHNLLLTHLPDWDFCAVASWAKPTWNHFEVHWNGQRRDKRASQAKRKEK